MNPCEAVTLTVWAGTEPREGDAGSIAVMTHYRALNAVVGLLGQGETSGMLNAVDDETFRFALRRGATDDAVDRLAEAVAHLE